jgi:RNA polymerase sigma-70 factor (ECF subfamily)
MMLDSDQTRGLLDLVRQGDRKALQKLLARYQPDVHAFVEVRLDPRVRVRVAPSDVVQETQMDVVRRMDDYLRREPMPFHLWVRLTAKDRLLKIHRDHLQAEIRSLTREAHLPRRSSLLLAQPLLARGPAPDEEAAAREFAERVSEAVAQLGEADREVLLLATSRAGRTTRSAPCSASSRRRPASATAGRCCGCGRSWPSGACWRLRHESQPDTGK